MRCRLLLMNGGFTLVRREFGWASVQHTSVQCGVVPMVCDQQLAVCSLAKLYALSTVALAAQLGMRAYPARPCVWVHQAEEDGKAWERYESFRRTRRIGRVGWRVKSDSSRQFARAPVGCRLTTSRYLVDPASSHMLVSKIKPCMSKYKHLYCETANGSLNQLSFIWLYLTTWITVVILELIHAKSPDSWKGCIY